MKPWLTEGARVRTRGPVDRYPHFRVPAGAEGTVSEVSDYIVTVRMDLPVEGAEDWENEVAWPEEDFASLETDLERVER